MRGVLEVIFGLAGMAGILAFYLLLLVGSAWLIVCLVRFAPLAGRRGRKGRRESRTPQG